MAWNKCYKCKWHTDKCKNQTRKTRKDRKCYFCGHYIPAGSSCLVTIDFVEHNVKYSCDNCYHGIIALYGD